MNNSHPIFEILIPGAETFDLSRPSNMKTVFTVSMVLSVLVAVSAVPLQSPADLGNATGLDRRGPGWSWCDVKKTVSAIDH